MLYHRRNVPKHNDKDLVRSLLRWFGAAARDLPWRERPLGGRRDPYRVLVSEIMLQQTQAARVAERFDAFIRRFPDARALADADEAEVLALWSGLGYYRRARLLHRAARAVADGCAGRFPQTPAELAQLPGIGRYTAGAIASLAFHERAPAVDANVTRVVLRLEGRQLAAADRLAAQAAWDRAAALHNAAPRRREAPALLNEALIELGATVCTPRNPRCAGCPVAGHCLAHARGLAGGIPAPRAPARRKPLYFASVLVADPAGRLAVTRRPAAECGGLWAGLHEAPTVERHDRAPTAAEIRRALGLGRRGLRRVCSFPFHTTHRQCTFDVYAAPAPGSPPGSWAFLPPERIAGLGLSSPQRRILLEVGPTVAPIPAAL